MQAGSVLFIFILKRIKTENSTEISMWIIQKYQDGSFWAVLKSPGKAKDETRKQLEIKCIEIFFLTEACCLMPEVNLI